MDRYAVLGQPIAHSRSPRIHAAFAQQTGAVLEYSAIEVAASDLKATLARLFDEGYAGLNLTLPLKVDAVPLCEALTPRAAQAGSVNTLSRGTSAWRGDNTDGAGLLDDLRGPLGIELKGRRVLLLGAGGAARGVLAPLLAAAPAELVVAGRTPWKPEALAAEFGTLGPVRPCTLLALKGDRFDLVLNATSAGHGSQALRLPPQLFAAGGQAYDFGYGEAAKPFLDWARNEGAAAVHDGLGMLVQQAAEAFLAWRGVRPDAAPVLALLRGEMA